MKRNYVKKAVLATVVSLNCLMAFSGTIYAGDTYTYQAENATESTTEGIVTYADRVGWVYKTENGVMYKRQFNYATSQWVGDWIVC